MIEMITSKLKNYLPYLCIALSILGIILAVITFAVIFTILDNAEKSVSEEVDAGVSLIGKIDDSFASVANETDNINKSLTDFNSSINSLELSIKNSGDSLSAIGDQISGITILPNIGPSGQKLSDAGHGLANTSGKLKSLENSTDSHIKALSSLRKKILDMEAIIKAQKQKISTLKDDLSNFFFLSKIVAFFATSSIVLMFVVLLMLSISKI